MCCECRRRAPHRRRAAARRGDGASAGVEAREQDVIAADVGAGGRAVGAGFAQCGAQQCAATRPARNPTTIFPERDDLESARLRDCIGIGTRSITAPWPPKIELEGKVTVAARDPEARCTRMCCEWIDHRCHIERGAKRRTPARVVRLLTAPTSHRPRLVTVAKMPGVTRRRSHRSREGCWRAYSPIAATLPFSTTT